MGINLDRRRLLLAASGGLAASAFPLPNIGVRAQTAGELRVLVGGGAFADANVEAYTKPFEKETGIKVTAIRDFANLAQIQLMVESKNITVDAFTYDESGSVSLSQKGFIEDIDTKLYQADQLAAIPEFTKRPWGMAALMYSHVMVYNTKTYPSSKERPADWKQFWDVEKFPGVRVLKSGESGTEGPWEEALLADGVAPADIYPMDIDRIFASLDRIKPHVRKWWFEGSEIVQILRDGAADLANCYDGRVGVLIEQGLPLEINSNQSKLMWDYWLIPKGSPNRENAQKFIQFAMRAENQANFAKLIPYGPTNLDAFKLIPDERGRQLASHPDTLPNRIPLNVEWYTAKASDGRANFEHLIQRWNEWIIK